MEPPQFDLLGMDVPVAFTDGTDVYDKLAQTYATHSKGLYILAPSGAGKTYFIEHQTIHDWVDGDVLWQATKAHPDGPWWNLPLEQIMELEARSDVITQEAKRLGFWIIGGSNTWLQPDAIVLPPWQTQKHRMSMRASGNYDGGLTPDQTEKALTQRRWFRRWLKQGVPQFTSIEEAAAELAARG